VPAASLIQLKEIFLASTEVVAESIPRAFRLVRALNAAVYDSAMVGIAKRLALGGPLDSQRILTAYENLLQNSDYRQACERATADEANVRKRRSLAISAFASV